MDQDSLLKSAANGNRRDLSRLLTYLEQGMKLNFPKKNQVEKLFHVSLLEKLIEKQSILYTRLSLSDDPAAKTPFIKPRNLY